MSENVDRGIYGDSTVRLTGTTTVTAPSIPTTVSGTPFPGVTIRTITTAEEDA